MKYKKLFYQNLPDEPDEEETEEKEIAEETEEETGEETGEEDLYEFEEMEE